MGNCFLEVVTDAGKKVRLWGSGNIQCFFSVSLPLLSSRIVNSFPKASYNGSAKVMMKLGIGMVTKLELKLGQLMESASV